MKSNNYFKKCDKCGKEYNACSVRVCPHVAVNKTFGKHICIYCCRHCREHTEEQNSIGCKLFLKSVDK